MKKIIIVITIIVILIVLLSFLREKEPEITMESFIKCLEDSGVIIYGSRTCPACTALANDFGGYEKIESIYIECSQEPERCDLEMKDFFVPEIQIQGELYEGARTLEGLSERTNCQK